MFFDSFLAFFVLEKMSPTVVPRPVESSQSRRRESYRAAMKMLTVNIE